MHRNQLRPIWKRRLNLHLVDHLGDAGHDVVARQHGSACTHEFGDALAVASQFEQVAGNESESFLSLSTSLFQEKLVRPCEAAIWVEPILFNILEKPRAVAKRPSPGRDAAALTFAESRRM